MSRSAQDLLRFHGIQPTVDTSGMDLSEFNLRTTDDLDALRDAAFAEADRLGRPGRLYSAWTEALRRDLDSELVDLNASNGSMPKSVEQLSNEIELNKGSNARYFVRQHMKPELQQVTLDGQSLADLPVEYAMARLHGMLVDAEPGPQRDAVSRLIADLDGTPATSFSNIEWSVPEERLTVEINSSNAQSPDAYSQWRNGGNGDHGLEGLAIKRSVSNDIAFSGITNMAGTSMTYEVQSDWAYQQAAASATSGEADSDD